MSLPSSLPLRNSSGPGGTLAAGIPFASELVLLGVALLAFLVVWPFGEYAILDDWAFAKSLEHLHFEGKLVVLDWNPMTLIGHLVWGVLFTKLFGFSFIVTKISTFVAGVVLVLCVKTFVTHHGLRPSVALLAGLALLLNPLFLAHIFMYMTDVTSLAWQWLSLVGLVVAIRREGPWSAGWAITCSICWGLAYLTRQHGVAIPTAFAIYIVCCERSLLRRIPLVAGVYLPGIAVAIAGTVWQRLSQEPTDAFQVMTRAVLTFVTRPQWFDLPFIAWSYAVYAGLFAIPMCFAVGFQGMVRLSGWRLWTVLAGGTVGLNLFVHFTMRGWYFPYIRNVITPWGMFGPNVFAIQADAPPVWALEWGIVVGFAGLLSAVWLLSILCRPLAESAESPDELKSDRLRAWRLLQILLLVQVTYTLATAPVLFDRHLLLFAPTVICLAAIGCPLNVQPRIAIPAVVLSFYAVYGVVCTHDIHAVSRAVFLEGSRLIESGVDPAQIDAGYAFDGWHMYERSAVVMTPPLVQISPWWPTAYPLPVLKSYGSPWWISALSTQVRPGYVITDSTRIPEHMFDKDVGFEEVPGQHTFRTYWPYREHQVRVFKARPDRSLLTSQEN